MTFDRNGDAAERVAVGRRTGVRGRLEAILRGHIAPAIFKRAPLTTLSRWHAVRRRLWPRRYTDADPFETLRVSPERITGSVLHVKPRWPQWGRVVGGEWDRAVGPFWRRPVPRAIDQRFRDGEDWAETALRPYFRRLIETYGNAWGHTSMADFDRRCAEIDGLYRRIEREGYRSQRELARAGDPSAVPVLDEVTVDIGRDGAHLWRGMGQHRLAVATVQGIEAIPVAVQRRHREWQRRRARLRGRPDAEEVSDHPDLVGLAQAPPR